MMKKVESVESCYHTLMHEPCMQLHGALESRIGCILLQSCSTISMSLGEQVLFNNDFPNFTEAFPHGARFEHKVDPHVMDVPSASMV